MKEFDKDWVIIAAPHDQKGANELYDFLRYCGVREYMMGDRFRAFYDAMGLNPLKSAAWRNGIYIGGIKEVEDWFSVSRSSSRIANNWQDEEQLELPFGY